MSSEKTLYFNPNAKDGGELRLFAVDKVESLRQQINSFFNFLKDDYFLSGEGFDYLNTPPEFLKSLISNRLLGEFGDKILSIDKLDYSLEGYDATFNIIINTVYGEAINVGNQSR